MENASELEGLEELVGKTVIIKIVGECILPNIPENDEMFRQIARLNQLGIPVIMNHGGGVQIERRAGQSYQWTKVGGRRVTTLLELENFVIPSYEETNVETANRIVKNGGNSLSAVQSGIERISAIRIPELGYVGAPNWENIDALMGAFDRQQVPVIGFIGYQRQQPLNINADDMYSVLIESMYRAGNPVHRILSVTPVGGIMLSQGKGSLLRYVKAEDIPVMIRSGIITNGMQPKAQGLGKAVTECEQYLPLGSACQIYRQNGNSQSFN